MYPCLSTPLTGNSAALQPRFQAYFLDKGRKTHFLKANPSNGLLHFVSFDFLRQSYYIALKGALNSRFSNLSLLSVGSLGMYHYT